VSRTPDSLIGELARDLAPVRRVPRLRRVAALALALGLAAATASILLWGLNATFSELRAPPRYWIAILGLLAFSAGGSTAALGSSIPGRELLIRGGVIAMVLGAALAVTSSALFLLRLADGEPAGSPWSALSFVCMSKAALIAIPAGVLLAGFAARAFPRRPSLTVGCGALAGVAFGALPVSVSCGSENILHVVFAHTLSPLSVGLVLWAALWGVYRWLVARQA